MCPWVQAPPFHKFPVPLAQRAISSQPETHLSTPGTDSTSGPVHAAHPGLMLDPQQGRLESRQEGPRLPSLVQLAPWRPGPWLPAHFLTASGPWQCWPLPRNRADTGSAGLSGGLAAQAQSVGLNCFCVRLGAQTLPTFRHLGPSPGRHCPGEQPDPTHWQVEASVEGAQGSVRTPPPTKRSLRRDQNQRPRSGCTTAGLIVGGQAGAGGAAGSEAGAGCRSALRGLQAGAGAGWSRDRQNQGGRLNSLQTSQPEPGRPRSSRATLSAKCVSHGQAAKRPSPEASRDRPPGGTAKGLKMTDWLGVLTPRPAQSRPPAGGKGVAGRTHRGRVCGWLTYWPVQSGPPAVGKGTGRYARRSCIRGRLAYLPADQPDLPPASSLLICGPLLPRDRRGRAALCLRVTQPWS